MSISIPDAGAVAKHAPLSLISKDPAAPSLLSIGEEAKISIMQRLSSRQYLVAVKDRMVLADSAVPLKAGAELLVRVDSQHPLMLRILSEADSPMSVFTQHLRFFRANPQGLWTNFIHLEELLAKAILDTRLSAALRNDIRVLLQSMGTLRYSQDAVGNRNYLRNYPRDLGLLLESSLKKILLANGERKPANDGTWGGVKGLLFHLAEKVSDSLGDAMLPEETRLFLTRLQTSVEESVRAIENQQILNVMLQETERTHMLQIPLMFPGGMTLGEIFIHSDDQGAAAAGGEKTFTIELLLEMDLLGHLLVEVRVHDKKLDCSCRCGDEVVREFISSQLPELRLRLVSAGYSVERLACVFEPDLEEQESARRGQHLLYTSESINLFA
jgi:hypothetical protein